MANLTPQQIKDSYQSLITTSETTSDPTTGTLQNGKGTPMTALTLSGAMTAGSFIGSGASLTALDLPSFRVRWTLNFANLVNGAWNNIPFNDVDFANQGGYTGTVMSLSQGSTADASVQINVAGIYAIITEAHFFDLFNNIDFRVGVYLSTTSATTGFNLVRAVSDAKFAELSSDQLVTGVSVFNFQTVPCWVQMRVNPSTNTPYPSDTDSAPNAMTIVRIGQ